MVVVLRTEGVCRHAIELATERDESGYCPRCQVLVKVAEPRRVWEEEFDDER